MQPNRNHDHRDDARRDDDDRDRGGSDGDHSYGGDRGYGYGTSGYGYDRDQIRDRDRGGMTGYDGAGYGREARATGGDSRGPQTGGHRGKGPAGYQRSDERIKEDVCELLTHDDQVDASGIQIEVKQGEVTLSGQVSDRRTKRMAEECIERVIGVTDVHNQLRIQREGAPRSESTRRNGSNGDGKLPS